MDNPKTETTPEKKDGKTMNWKIVGIGCAVITGVELLILLIMTFYGISINNKEVILRNTIQAKQKDNTNEYDNMWKTIAQTAQVTDAQKNALKEIFVSHAQARAVESKNLLMAWIKESVPNVDTSTFNKLISIIESTREKFTMRQKELIDIKREHDILLDKFPSSIILSILGRQKIEITIVTSTRTENAFKTGKDDDIDVFQKPKQAEK